MTITGWGVFWVFIIIFFFVDLHLFNQGYDTFFWSYKTPSELEKQKTLLGIDK